MVHVDREHNDRVYAPSWWMSPIWTYLATNALPQEASEARKVRHQASHYVIIDNEMLSHLEAIAEVCRQRSHEVCPGQARYTEEFAKCTQEVGAWQLESSASVTFGRPWEQTALSMTKLARNAKNSTMFTTCHPHHSIASHSLTVHPLFFVLDMFYLCK